MKILLVNDDGYDKPGILKLKNILKDYGEVFIAAPHVEQSGVSCTINHKKGIKIHKHSNICYSIESSPADCVKYGVNLLFKNIDIIVSGINNGYNLGLDTIYSGTVGACFQGLAEGKKAIAFSTDTNFFDNINVKKVIDYVLKNDLLSTDYLLNVNFQSTKFKDDKGMLITSLDIRKHKLIFTEIDGLIYRKRKPIIKEHVSIDYDIEAILNGYISITPLMLGNCTKELTENLKNKIKKTLEI